MSTNTDHVLFDEHSQRVNWNDIFDYDGIYHWQKRLFEWVMHKRLSSMQCFVF